MAYIISRKVNNKEYHLENIQHDKVVWTTDRHNALEFNNKAKLEEFIQKEFPGKDYYVTQLHGKKDWPSDIIVKP